MPSRFLLPAIVALLLALPAFAAHTGITRRNGYSWSDVAIFAIVMVTLILARRALRRRFRARGDAKRD